MLPPWRRERRRSAHRGRNAGIAFVASIAAAMAWVEHEAALVDAEVRDARDALDDLHRLRETLHAETTRNGKLDGAVARTLAADVRVLADRFGRNALLDSLMPVVRRRSSGAEIVLVATGRRWGVAE